MRSWQYYLYLFVRSGFGVGAWFALEAGYPELSHPVLRALAASAGGVILLENVSLKSAGVDLSMGDSLEGWRDTIITQSTQSHIQSGERARGRKTASRARIIELGMRRPFEQVQSRVQNLIAGAEGDRKRNLQEELEQELKGVTDETDIKREMLSFMLNIDQKSTKKFVGQS